MVQQHFGTISKFDYAFIYCFDAPRTVQPAHEGAHDEHDGHFFLLFDQMIKYKFVCFQCTL